MIGRFSAAVGAVFLSFILFSAPSYAGAEGIIVGAIIRGIAEGVASSAMDNAYNSPPTPQYSWSAPSAPPSGSWYQNWLLSRQSGNGQALYNHPCMMSDGLSQFAVHCEAVASTLDGGPPLANSSRYAIVDTPLVGGWRGGHRAGAAHFHRLH
jgi:hypothetical protein